MIVEHWEKGRRRLSKSALTAASRTQASHFNLILAERLSKS
jgi:hypothetical protein